MGHILTFFAVKTNIQYLVKLSKKLAEELQNTELLQINRSCIVNSQKCIELKDGTCPALKLINKEIIKPITMNLLKLKELFNIKD